MGRDGKHKDGQAPSKTLPRILDPVGGHLVGVGGKGHRKGGLLDDRLLEHRAELGHAALDDAVEHRDAPGHLLGRLGHVDKLDVVILKRAHAKLLVRVALELVRRRPVVHFRQDVQERRLARAGSAHEERRALEVVGLLKLFARLRANLVGQGTQASPAEKERHDVDKGHVAIPHGTRLVERKHVAQKILQVLHPLVAVLPVGLRDTLRSLGLQGGNHVQVFDLGRAAQQGPYANVLRGQQLVQAGRGHCDQWHLEPISVKVSVVKRLGRDFRRAKRAVVGQEAPCQPSWVVPDEAWLLAHVDLHLVEAVAKRPVAKVWLDVGNEPAVDQLFDDRIDARLSVADDGTKDVLVTRGRHDLIDKLAHLDQGLPVARGHLERWIVWV